MKAKPLPSFEDVSSRIKETRKQLDGTVSVRDQALVQIGLLQGKLEGLLELLAYVKSPEEKNE